MIFQVNIHSELSCNKHSENKVRQYLYTEKYYKACTDCIFVKQGRKYRGCEG